MIGIGCTVGNGCATGKGWRRRGGTGFGVTGGAIAVPEEVCAETFTTTKVYINAMASSVRIFLLSLIALNINSNASGRHGVLCYHDGEQRESGAFARKTSQLSLFLNIHGCNSAVIGLPHHP
jgi:hypothetical protein